MDLLKRPFAQPVAVAGLPPPVFRRLRDIVYGHAGLFFEDSKQYFVEKRLERRMQDLRIVDPEEYLRRLEADLGRAELHNLIEELTVNETYFFRNVPQLEGFSTKVLPRLIAAKRQAGTRTLRIWSAACSTGEEPYTLAIILREALPDLTNWHVEVLGTDIDRNALRTAHRATYEARSVKDVPPDLLTRYFTVSDGKWQVAPEVTKLVSLQQVNLIDKHAMRRMSGFDVIFCRNVLIYFDDSSRRLTLGYFYDALNPGGYVFLGHSESVGRITAAFRIERLETFLCYSKQAM
ncbi:MAG: protein-glutamate O-methyltransferase CheR [Verrucomicrobia bacterium]|nr:protein-glutamate O-methyltransferase CheR [Verrucomicrobiota bacterium]